MIETRSSSSSLSIPRKVCMIFPAPFPESEYGHDIFIVDLNTDLRDLSPKIRVVGEAFRSAAFCVLGTTLYVFDGYDGVGRRGKTVSKYDFSEHNNNNKGGGLITLSCRKQLKWVCRMNDIKIWPVVIPTPDGKKIVVFSTTFQSLDSSSSSNFELFDPFAAEPNCKTLPDLFRSPFSSEIGWVQLFSFLNKDVLFVQTSLSVQAYRSGMYQLNLNLVDQGRCWEPFLFVDQTSINDQFQVIGDDICLTPKRALQINVPGFPESVSSNRCWFYTLPASAFSPPHGFFESHIALLDNHPQDRLFCILRKWIHEEEEDLSISQEDEDLSISQEEEEKRYTPKAILDVYKCNLPACKEEMVKFEEKQRKKIKRNMIFELFEFQKKQSEKIISNMMVEFEEKQKGKKKKKNPKNKKVQSNRKNKIAQEEGDDKRKKVDDKRKKAQLIIDDKHKAAQLIIGCKVEVVESEEKQWEKIKSNMLVKLVELQEKQREKILSNMMVEFEEKQMEKFKLPGTEFAEFVIACKEELFTPFAEFVHECGIWLDNPELPEFLNASKKELVVFEKKLWAKNRSNIVEFEEKLRKKTELVNACKKYLVESEKNMKNKIMKYMVESEKNMKNMKNKIVGTQLPGTELVKSFQIEFDPQPSTYALLRIFPLQNFFSIPT